MAATFLKGTNGIGSVLDGGSKSNAASNPVFGGAVRGKLTLKPGSQVTDNEYGLDVLVRTFVAATDDIYTLAPKRGDADKFIPNMNARFRSFSEGSGRMSEVTITYQGIIDDKIKEPTIEGSLQEQSSTLPTSTIFGGISSGILLIGPGGIGYQTIQNFITGSVTISYKSAVTTFKYAARKLPDGPKYPNTIFASVASIEVTGVGSSNLSQRPMGSLSCVTTAFSVEKAGKYYQVSETNQILLLPPSSSSLDLSVAFNAIGLTKIS